MGGIPLALLVTVCVLAAGALTVSGVALSLVLRSTPLRLLGRQNDLESQMEATLRGATRLETAWTQFLVEREELEETIRDGIRRSDQKNRGLAARESRLNAMQDEQQGYANGGGESLEQFERRMTAGR